MAALTRDEMRTYELGAVNEYPVIAAAVIWEGAAVGLNAAGNAQALAVGNEFTGFAERQADNRVGPNGAPGVVGAKNVRVKSSGLIVLSVTGASATSVGLAVFATNDNTFTLTRATNAVRIGRVYRHISGTTVVVEFRATALEALVAAPTGGATIDAESRTAITAIIDRLEFAGIVFPR